MPRNAKKLGKTTHTFLAERCFYTQPNGQPEEPRGSSWYGHSFIRVLRMGIWSSAGWGEQLEPHKAWALSLGAAVRL